MQIRPRLVTSLLSVLLGLSALPAAHAAPAIMNGGFESGFANWTTLDQTGSEGTFYLQSGTTSPTTGLAVAAPPEGSQAAMSDAGLGGPGTHVMYQDFVASAVGATLSFELFIGNRANDFYTPATLDFATTALNQQARVDILKAGADAFSVDSGDILMTLYQTQVGDAPVSGYTTISQDITALLAAHNGETLRLRFAEADNVDVFQMGVDNVRIEVQGKPLPEPASLLLLVGALGALAARRRL